MNQRIKGVLSPVVTPFTRDLAPDADRFVRHCKWLLSHGCSGLAVFGTNSEANSLSVDERVMLLEALIEAGVPASKLMPGTGCSALSDSVLRSPGPIPMSNVPPVGPRPRTEPRTSIR